MIPGRLVQFLYRIFCKISAVIVACEETAGSCNVAGNKRIKWRQEIAACGQTAAETIVQGPLMICVIFYLYVDWRTKYRVILETKYFWQHA